MLTRRNPLVVLLCLELMLNAANLALIAFARMWGNGDGQIFAIIVMVVAACEVSIGLGLIVAIYRRRLPIDVDETAGAARLACETTAWLVLALPARRHDRHRRWASASGRARSPACIGTLRDRRRVRLRGRDLHLAAGPRRGARARSSSSPWDYANDGRRRRARSRSSIDPLSVLMALVVTGVSTLIHLYSVAYMQRRPRATRASSPT